MLSVGGRPEKVLEQRSGKSAEYKSLERPWRAGRLDSDSPEGTLNTKKAPVPSKPHGLQWQMLAPQAPGC